MVLTEKFNRFSIDPARLVGSHDMEWGESDGPSADWRNGAPLGNGDFGAIVYGCPDNLTFALAKTDLWVRLAKGTNFPPGTFADVREIYRNGDRERYEELRRAEDVTPNLRTSHVTTAGFLRLNIADASICIRCRQHVSLYEAVCTYSFRPTRVHADVHIAHETPFTVTSFCSRIDDVLAIRIDPGEQALGTVTGILGRQTHPCLSPAISEIADSDYLVEQELAKGDRYVMAMRVLGHPCEAQLVPRGVLAECAGETLEPLTILLTIVSRRDTEDFRTEAVRRLNRAEEKGFNVLLADHKAWWKDFWSRSFVSVADASAEKWWYLSNYLAGSATRPGKVSPGLQGVWIKENVPAWNGDYHANINIQSDYWGLLGGNRLDLMEPYFRLYTEMLPQCRKDTAEYFRMRGARLPHAGDVDGHELCGNSWFVLAVHPSVTGWLAQLFWQYYQYTGDLEFLREVAYLVISDAAAFYTDYVQWDETAGCYVIEPSISFEAFCPEWKALGTNSNYDVAIFRMTFQMAIEAAETLGDSGPLPAEWKERLEKLTPFPKTPQGAWAAWEGRGAIHRGHGGSVPFLTPIFPCGLVSAFHGSPEEQAAAWASWRIMRAMLGEPGILETSNRAWCGGSPIATAAAMGDAEAAMYGVRWCESEDRKSGLLFRWDKHYLQADHGSGMALALNSMMLGSYGGTVHVFPAMPTDIDARFHSLRAPGAFLVSSEQREGRVAYVIVQSLIGNQLRIASPFFQKQTNSQGAFRTPVIVRDMYAGRIIFRANCLHQEVISLDTEPGHVYSVEDENSPLESWEPITIDPT